MQSFKQADGCLCEGPQQLTHQMLRRWITDSLAQLKDMIQAVTGPCPTDAYAVTITGTDGTEAWPTLHGCALATNAQSASGSCSWPCSCVSMFASRRTSSQDACVSKDVPRICFGRSAIILTS